MRNLLKKELKLSTSPLAWFFLLFSLMTFLPGYPILMGSFFICLGQFQSFVAAREANDILYTVLLPVRKTDVVTAKYTAAGFFELAGLVLMAVFTVIRMTLLADSPVYTRNALMNATPVFLAFVLVIFMLFNVIFLGGFFKTAYKIGKPFILFIIAAMVVTGIAESLIHIPGLTFLHSPTVEKPAVQYAALAAAAVLYELATGMSKKKSKERFEQIDL